MQPRSSPGRGTDTSFAVSSSAADRDVWDRPLHQLASRSSNLRIQPSGLSSTVAPVDAMTAKPTRLPVISPCFVHSQLESPSLTEWLRAKQSNTTQNARAGGQTVQEISDSEEEEGEASLSEQLAETVAGVREMSKQLGRAQIRPNIRSVLIVTKARDNRLIKLTRELALYLMLKPREAGGRGTIVYVDAQLQTSRRFDAAGIQRDHPELLVPIPRRRPWYSSSDSSSASPASDKSDSNHMPEGQLRYWTSDMCKRSPHLFNCVVTLGDDDTVLYTSWLFQRVVPLVLPFALGPFGSLSNFDFANHKSVIDNTMDSGVRINLRMRITCTVYHAVAPELGKGRRAAKKSANSNNLIKEVEEGGWEALEKSHTTRSAECFDVLNELVVDRGNSPYVSLLELFGDEHHITTVHADGLTVSTPTGSAARSLSAGGSLVHPEIPAVLVTPICPDALSFRPMLLPDSMELRVCVPWNSTSTAWVSFDGRGRSELKQGDHIKITASKYPVPTVCSTSQSTDWFQSISRTLKWNESERQEPVVIVKDDRPTRPRNGHLSSTEEDFPEDEEEDEVTEREEDEEDEKFDIDDLSFVTRITSRPNNLSAQPSVSPMVAPVSVEALRPSQLQSQPQAGPARSPHFVPSQLQSPRVTDWLGASRQGVHDEEESTNSLTRHLAKTAVGVREMSKQLGRTRVRSNVQSVLIVTKARDNELIELTRELAVYLMSKTRNTGGRGIIVYVDAQLQTSRKFDAAGIERDHPHLFAPLVRSSSSSSLSSMASNRGDSNLTLEGQLRYWTMDMCSQSSHLFDVVVTLGGDSAVLYTSWLFQRIVPPILAFALGSLGYLSNFDFANHQSIVNDAIDAGLGVNMRMRITCTVYRAIDPELGEGRSAVKKDGTGEMLKKMVEQSGWEAFERGHASIEAKRNGGDEDNICHITKPVERFEILNDLVIDSGPSAYVSLLELFGDQQHLTTVHADGLTVSTPTGSTAYSLSAGGSLVHPGIPAILITPICPHNSSFRPMLLPDTMELRLCVPHNSSGSAWVSFDGRERVELKEGDHLKITASKYPFPTVCSISQSTDWFQSLSRTLKWNASQQQQQSLLAEDSPWQKLGRRHSPSSSDLEKEDSIPDEEEDDIDDLSSAESTRSSSRMTDPDSPSDQLSDSLPFAGYGRADADARSAGVHVEAAVHALAQSNTALQTHRSRARDETSDRWSGPQPHPPRLPPRLVQRAAGSGYVAPSPTSLTARPNRDAFVRGERGATDDLVTPRNHYAPIPHGRGIQAHRPPAIVPSRRHSLGRAAHGEGSGNPNPRRAFAVWGQDESDSAASDSD